MSRTQIPTSVMGAAGDVLGDLYYHSHSKLNTIFMEAGAPGDPPVGNCVEKCVSWLRRCNEDPSVIPLDVLGRVLQDFMDREFVDGRCIRGQKRIRDALTRNNLSNELNGRVLQAGSAVSSRALADILRRGDFSAVETEFHRALASVESDPPASLTAAFALIEALCKAYIEERALVLPTKQTIKNLWHVVGVDLGFKPASLSDYYMKHI